MIEVPNRTIEYLVGIGATGLVYRARHQFLDRPEAIKVLHEHHCSNETFVRRFLQEVQVLSRLSHPSIVRIFEAGTCGDRYFASLEFVDGPSLLDCLRTGPLPAPVVVDRFLELSRALAFAHEKGMIHRDIKPANILLPRVGPARLVDFGLARDLGEDRLRPRLTRASIGLGTPAFMPPEQAKDAKSAGRQADIFSLGATLFTALTRWPPTRIVSLQPGENKVGPPRLFALIRHMMALESRERPEDLDCVIAELEAIRAQIGTAGPGGRDPLEAAPSPTPSQPITSRRIFSMLCDEVFRDGVLEDEEFDILRRTASLLGLPRKEAATLARASRQKFQGPRARPDAGALSVRAFYGRALEAAFADGAFEEIEARLLRALRDVLGIDDAFHDALVDLALAEEEPDES